MNIREQIERLEQLAEIVGYETEVVMESTEEPNYYDIANFEIQNVVPFGFGFVAKESGNTHQVVRVF